MSSYIKPPQIGLKFLKNKDSKNAILIKIYINKTTMSRILSSPCYCMFCTFYSSFCFILYLHIYFFISSYTNKLENVTYLFEQINSGNINSISSETDFSHDLYNNKEGKSWADLLSVSLKTLAFLR